MASDTEDFIERISDLKHQLDGARKMIAKRIIGQRKAVDLALTAMLSGGHALLLGVPGLGKTRLVETLSVVMGLTSNRIQCTPDLMPADILGSEILQQAEDGSRRFEFVQGPVFCQLLMADEINRASPRTQSALLQAMEERTVSIANVDYTLPKPFLVLATQNPIELEGTYRLPEAQLDRFSLRIDINNPSSENEREILLATTGTIEETIEPVFDAETLLAAQSVVRSLPVGEEVLQKIISLVRKLRPNSDATTSFSHLVRWGPGVRASQTLGLAARAKALLRGDIAPNFDDVRELAVPVLAHRMSLKFAAQADNNTPESIIEATLSEIHE